MKLKKKELRLAENVTDEEFWSRYGNPLITRWDEAHRPKTNRGDNRQTTELRGEVSNAFVCPRSLEGPDSSTPNKQNGGKEA